MIKKISENIWEIEKEKDMRVPGRIFASEKLFEKIKSDKTIEQVKNVAKLPGIVRESIAMSDAHQGYGFCVGGVAAFDVETGIISPGGIGYDINCGVRLLSTNLSKEKFLKKRALVLNEIYKKIPSGVGEESKTIFSEKEINEILEKGSHWALERKMATKKDIENTEDNGKIEGADARKVSQRAKARGRKQIGTLGAGNHFIEIQEVENIFNAEIAKKFKTDKKERIVVMIHTGSRGLGHQTASDYIMKMEKTYGFEHLPDRELAYAPINSELGKDYRSAMAAAANFAFANRQIITHHIREAFKKFFPESKVSVVYDIAHNIAKFEEFKINGKKKILCVHRKGATRSFGKNRKEIPKEYRKTGCPIFIPGSMGTESYVLAGTEKAREISFASTPHGAGRVLSRNYAKQTLSAEKIRKALSEKNIMIKAGSEKGLVEEAPEAYKDVNEVVKVGQELGIATLVTRLKPVAVVKG